jgi:hypothetical protein
MWRGLDDEPEPERMTRVVEVVAPARVVVEQLTLGL